MTELPYLRVDKDRHGNERIFVRRNGRNIRLRESPGTAGFQREYANALQQIANVDRIKKAAEAKRPVLASIKPRTFGWIAARYFGSGEFAGLDPVSQRRIRTIIESCLQEDFKGESMRDCPVSMLTAAKIKSLRDAKMDKKGAANKRLQYLSAMFGWAVEDGCMPGNPARDVKKLKYATDGFHTWTVEDRDARWHRTRPRDQVPDFTDAISFETFDARPALSTASPSRGGRLRYATGGSQDLFVVPSTDRHVLQSELLISTI